MIRHTLPAGSFIKNGPGRVAAAIVARLRERGFEAWLAGGCVRDVYLGFEPKDFDIATAARPEQVIALFSKVVETGVRYGTVTVIEDGVAIEVTTFRTDGAYEDGRHPTKLVFGVSAREDALRRDFTINALFGDPAADEIVDFVGGIADAKAKILRTVGRAGDRFEEDALRLLRGVRFAARLGWDFEIDTSRAMRARPHLLRKLSPERISAELIKMLTGRDAGAALRLLENYQFIDEFLPEAGALRGVPQPPQFHPEGDCWVHTIDVVQRLDRKTPILTLAALFHDIGKALTLTLTDRIRFHGHEPRSCELAEPRLRALRFSNEIITNVLDLIAEHIRIAGFRQWRRAKQLRFLQKENIDDHLSLHFADCSSAHGMLDNYHEMQSELAKIRSLPPPAEPIVRGSDLQQWGYLPGKQFKEILTAVRDAQLEERIRNIEEARAFVLKNFPR